MDTQRLRGGGQGGLQLPRRQRGSWSPSRTKRCLHTVKTHDETLSGPLPVRVRHQVPSPLLELLSLLYAAPGRLGIRIHFQDVRQAAEDAYCRFGTALLGVRKGSVTR